MLPKQYSFNLRQERGFFEKAKKVFSQKFTLFYIPAPHFGTVVVVPKKRVALATGRTAVKRKITAAIEKIIPEVDLNSASFFVCLVAKSAAVTAPRELLEKELLKAFSSLQKE